MTGRAGCGILYTLVIVVRRNFRKMSIARGSNKLPRLVQLLLLLIPGVNWITEIVVRWSAFLTTKSLFTLIFAIVVTVVGIVSGWIDLIWVLLFKHLIFAKA